MPTPNVEIYDFGRFRLDVDEHVLTERGVRLPLAEKAFRTLTLLVRSSGSLVSHQELMEAIWPDAIVEKNNLSKAIHAIRTILGDAGDEPRFIETVPKHGYRFIAGVTRVDGDRERNRHTGHRTSGIRSPAYDAYIRGKVKAGSENTADLDEAIQLLETAVAIDPLFAKAFAQLARACNTRAFKFSPSTVAVNFHERAEIALEKALDLDPDLAEAHFARGLILWTKAKGFPHEHAIRAFRRSLELNPDGDEAHHQLSMVLAHVGLLDQAEEHVRIALGINPNNTMARFRVGAYAAWQCRFEEALAILRTVPGDISPMLIERSRAEVLIQLGRNAQAQAVVDDHLDAHPADEGGSFTSLKALLLAQEGTAAESDRMIARAIALGEGFGHFHHTAYNIASAHAALNRPDKAVGWLKAAADQGFPCYPYFNGDPNLECLHGHAGFVALMSALHRQWEEFGAGSGRSLRADQRATSARM